MTTNDLDSAPLTTESEAAGQPTSGPPGPRRPSATTALLLRLHFYAGLFVGPFLLVATISGGLYAIAPSIELVLYRDYLHARGDGAPRPVADQIRAAQEVRPDLAVTAVRPAVDAGQTTRVLFDDPTLGESLRRAVFVDPATALPQGELAVYGSSGALPVRTWIDQLHRNLHLGEPGRLYSELAASWLGVIAVAGVWLWVARYRRVSARGSARARLLTVDRSVAGRARSLNWHGVVGLWIAAGLLFLSATGLTWSTYAGANVDALRAALSWATPTVSTALGAPGATGPDTPVTGHAGHDHSTPARGPVTDSAAPPPRADDVDRVIEAARTAGVGGHVEVTIPHDQRTAFTVAQTREPWVMSNNSVAVDGASGRITDASWFSDWPWAAKLAAWGIQLHMGLLFGLANQLALLALAAALATVIIRGYLMWWRRRPRRGGVPVGRPPCGGSIRRLPRPAAAGVVLAAAALGWFVPLLGVSLLAFLVVDVAVGAGRRRRRFLSP